MTKYSEYYLAVSGSMLGLEDLVRKRMFVGWQPQGGVSIDRTGHGASYFQAMVR